MVFHDDSSLTPRQQFLIAEAIHLCTYPLNLIDADVTFTSVSEPSCPGHKDYMCTHETVVGLSGTASVEIRNNADDPNAPINLNNGRTTQSEVDKFFIESIIHELGHIVCFIFIASDSVKTTAAHLFYKNGPTGEGNAQGALADYDPLDKPWEDRIQEAIAEVFKDTYLDDRNRLYENRTNWDVSATDHTSLMRMLLPDNVQGIGRVRLPGGGNAEGDPGNLDMTDYSWPASAHVITDSVPPSPQHVYLTVNNWKITQHGPLEAWNDQDPLQFIMSYGSVWPPSTEGVGATPLPAWERIYHPEDTARHFPSTNYTIHATLSDKRNGKIFEWGVAVTGATPVSVAREDIRPKYPIDQDSLQGLIVINGLIPVYPYDWGQPDGTPDVSPARNFRGAASIDLALLGGVSDWGWFDYVSRSVKDTLPLYPYKDALLHAEAKALNAFALTGGAALR